jgi:uncharacterized membrane protein
MARRRAAKRPQAPPPPQGAMQRLRQVFLTGVVITLPLIITVWLLGILVRLLEGIASPVVLGILRLFRPDLAGEPAIVRYAAPLAGILLTVLLILTVGLLATHYLGRRLVQAFDRLMMRLPVVKPIYGAARQLLDAFSRTSTSFRRVVMVEYPRPGVYTVGFLTQSGVDLGRQGGSPVRGCSLVFLPTTPNPTSGWLALVRDEEVVPLDMSIEDGVKLIVSGGLVVPGRPADAP